MIKSQNPTVILFIIFLLSFICFSFSAFCESAKEKLILADSLFKQKKYTQSFELYENLLQSDKKTSPAMLLKMAFIKEGLGDFSSALYYLDLYYLKTYDKRALKKMENLAEQNKLSGYDYDDLVFFLNLYQQYRLQVDLSILSIFCLIFGILLYRKRQSALKPGFSGVVFICLLAALFIINNFGRGHAKAIISAPAAYLMKGPSPGSELIEIVTQGHRVDVLGKKDVWTKISWGDQTAYIKDFNLKYVKL